MKLKRFEIGIGVYWLATLFLAIAGASRGWPSYELLMACFVLTLPWSLIAGVFIFGALHLGDDTAISVLFMICASLNAAVFYFIGRRHLQPAAAK